MAALSFTLTNGKYVATISGATESKYVDIERDEKGVITVFQRANGTTAWKCPQDVEIAKYQANVPFNLLVEAGTVDFQIVSVTEVTSAVYV